MSMVEVSDDQEEEDEEGEYDNSTSRGLLIMDNEMALRRPTPNTGFHQFPIPCAPSSS